MRLYYYDTANVDSTSATPTGVAAADGSGTISTTVANDATIGTFGFIFDTSNASAGIVELGDLPIGGTTVLFLDAAAIPPEDEGEEGAGEEGAGEEGAGEDAGGDGTSEDETDPGAVSLPVTSGLDLLPVSLIGGAGAAGWVGCL